MPKGQEVVKADLNPETSTHGQIWGSIIICNCNPSVCSHLLTYRCVCTNQLRPKAWLGGWRGIILFCVEGGGGGRGGIMVEIHCLHWLSPAAGEQISGR